MKVIVVDDDQLVAISLKTILEADGQIQVLATGSNGQEAIDIYKEKHPDMIFLDLIMPVVDGKDALKEIIEFDPSAKVVIVSSIGTKEVLMETLKLGAREFIQKPFSELQIMNALYKSLK